MISRRIHFFILFLVIASCIEPYEFVITDKNPTIVIEALVSDKSFTDTKSYPSDGRYFTVKLSKTGDVINIRPEMILGATVSLINDLGEERMYTESFSQPGIYELLDDDFKASPSVTYKIKVTISENEVYESDWEGLPTTTAPEMGEIAFQETETKGFSYDGEVQTLPGVTPNISIPENNTGAPLYYRWKFTPTWIYVAPLANTDSPVRTCWATTPYYIRNYTLQTDYSGGYLKDLFFMQIDYNERIYEEFSVLVQQYSTEEETYYFWKEMQDLNQGATLFDTPPYNLKSNFHTVAGEKNVVGYFTVAGEQAKRWYFNINDLSYRVENTLLADCSNPCGPGCPPPNCYNCLRYEAGTPTNIRPPWWGR